MGNKNLFDEKAREKLQDMATSIDFAMMATNLKSFPLHMVPMSTKKVDDQGNIWFLSDRNSTHNKNLEDQPNLHLVYSDKGNMQFLNVYGVATISTDRTRIKELYADTDDAWFDGEDDPNITAISVAPVEAFYWDPKSNKLVSLLKMGIGAITGKEPDNMDFGKLKP